MSKVLSHLQAFAAKDNGKEFRLVLVTLSGTAAGIAILAPHLTGECAMVAFATNFLWIYGGKA